MMAKYLQIIGKKPLEKCCNYKYLSNMNNLYFFHYVLIH